MPRRRRFSPSAMSKLPVPTPTTGREQPQPQKQQPAREPEIDERLEVGVVGSAPLAPDAEAPEVLALGNVEVAGADTDDRVVQEIPHAACPDLLPPAEIGVVVVFLSPEERRDALPIRRRCD